MPESPLLPDLATRQSTGTNTPAVPHPATVSASLSRATLPPFTNSIRLCCFFGHNSFPPAVRLQYQLVTRLLRCFCPLESPCPSNFGRAVCFFTHLETFSQVHYSFQEGKVSPRCRDGGIRRECGPFLLLWHRTAETWTLDLLHSTRIGVASWRPPVVNSKSRLINEKKRPKDNVSAAFALPPVCLSVSLTDGGERED